MRTPVKRTESVDDALAPDARWWPADSPVLHISEKGAAALVATGARDGWVFPSEGSIVLVSCTPGGQPGSYAGSGQVVLPRPDLSADGRFIAFVSDASDLVPGDSNGRHDVFVRNVELGATVLVSGVPGSGSGPGPSPHSAALSADGRYVAFDIPIWPNPSAPVVLVRDLQTGALTPVAVTQAGVQANSESWGAGISADGRIVTFGTFATNLVAVGTSPNHNVFARDLSTGAITLVSASGEGVPGNRGSYSFSSAVSADGRYVAFESDATNLVAGDVNGRRDVFVKDLHTGELVCASPGIGGNGANGLSIYPALSADGRYVAFSSRASNLVPNDTNGVEDVFVFDLRTGATTRISTSIEGHQGNQVSGAASISADGRFVAFHSYAGNLVPGDTNEAGDVFVKDMETGALMLASVGDDGRQGDAASFKPALSADGRFLAFWSAAVNLVPGDTNGQVDVFVVRLDVDRSLSGTAGPDALVGWSGDDTLEGFEGDDSIDGAAGRDVVVYAAERWLARVTFEGTAQPYMATVIVPGLGTDSLRNVERLAFEDLGVAFDVTPTGNVDDPVTKGEGGNGGKAYRLYQAAFDRVPDLPGVGYWIAQVDQGERLFDIATGFIGSAEFEALYGVNPSNAEYTRALYRNVLDRDPDDAGYAYWNAVLGGDPWNGVDYGTTTRQQMLVDFSESAENQANVIGVIGNGFDFVPWLGE